MAKFLRFSPLIGRRLVMCLSPTCHKFRPVHSYVKLNLLSDSWNHVSLKTSHHDGRHYSTDATDIEEISIDKRLYQFIEKWDVDKAVSLAISGINMNNSSLSGHAITHLLEQLGEVGDTDNLLLLLPHLNGWQYVSAESVYYYLSKGFYNSGQMDQGAIFLKTVCVGDYNHEHINIIFTYLVVPTLQDFPDTLTHYIDTVNELMSLTDYFLVAVLWKCYVLCGQFSEADNLLAKYETETKSIFPVMVNEICQLKDRVVTKISHEDMLRYLMDVPQLRKKKQKILIVRTLLQILYSESRWFDLQTTLMVVKDSNIDLPKDIIQHHVRALKSCTNYENLGIDLVLMVELENWANEPQVTSPSTDNI